MDWFLYDRDSHHERFNSFQSNAAFHIKIFALQVKKLVSILMQHRISHKLMKLMEQKETMYYLLSTQ